MLAPNQRAPMEGVRSEYVLVTKGSASAESGSGAMSHCAHYYFNRVCNRGPACQFIHRVHIDPTAKPNQRAPAPRAVPGSRGSPFSTKKVASFPGSIGGPTSRSSGTRSNSSDESSPLRSIPPTDLSFRSCCNSHASLTEVPGLHRQPSYQLCHTPGRTYYVEVAPAVEPPREICTGVSSKYRHNPYS